MTDKINVKHNHSGLLDIAGVTARPKVAVAVDRKAFETWKHGHAAASWLKSGLVEVVDPVAKEPAASPASDPAPDRPVKVDRAALLARAAELELGLKANVSNKELVAAVAAAEAGSGQ